MTTQTTVKNSMLTFNAEQMKQIKKLASSFRLKRSSHEFQRVVQFSVKNKIISISVANEENLATLNFESETELENCIFYVPIEILKKLTGIKKDSFYSFNYNGDQSIIFNNNGVSVMLTTNNVIFPLTPKLKDSNFFETNENYIQALKNSLAFTTKNGIRPVLDHILHENNSIITTDSHKMLKTENIHSLQDDRLVVKQETALILTKLVKNGENMIVEYDDNIIKYTKDNLTVIGKLFTSGNYPNLNNVFPNTYGRIIEIDSNHIVNIFEQVSKTNIKNHMINFKINKYDKTLYMYAIGDNMSKIELTVPCKIVEMDSEEYRISFNARNVLESIKQNKDSVLTFKFNGSLSPFTVTASNNHSSIYLYSPVRPY